MRELMRRGLSLFGLEDRDILADWLLDHGEDQAAEAMRAYGPSLEDYSGDGAGGADGYGAGYGGGMCSGSRDYGDLDPHFGKGPADGEDSQYAYGHSEGYGAYNGGGGRGGGRGYGAGYESGGGGAW